MAASMCCYLCETQLHCKDTNNTASVTAFCICAAAARLHASGPAGTLPHSPQQHTRLEADDQDGAISTTTSSSSSISSYKVGHRIWDA
jgi:hypothetical protein